MQPNIPKKAYVCCDGRQISAALVQHELMKRFDYVDLGKYFGAIDHEDQVFYCLA